MENVGDSGVGEKDESREVVILSSSNPDQVSLSDPKQHGL